MPENTPRNVSHEQPPTPAIGAAPQLLDLYCKAVQNAIDAEVYRRHKEPATMLAPDVQLLCGHNPAHLADWLWKLQRHNRIDLPPECWFAHHIDSFQGEMLDAQGNRKPITLPAGHCPPDDFSVSRIVFRPHMIDLVTLYAEALNELLGWQRKSFYREIMSQWDATAAVRYEQGQQGGLTILPESDGHRRLRNIGMEEWYRERTREVADAIKVPPGAAELRQRKMRQSLSKVVTNILHIASTEQYSKSSHSQERLAARLGCARETVRKALGLGKERCPMIAALKQWSEHPGSKAPKKFYVHTESDLAKSVIAEQEGAGSFLDSFPAQIEDPTALMLDDEVEAHVKDIYAMATLNDDKDSLEKLRNLTPDQKRELVGIYVKDNKFELPKSITNRGLKIPKK